MVEGASVFWDEGWHFCVARETRVVESGDTVSMRRQINILQEELNE